MSGMPQMHSMRTDYTDWVAVLWSPSWGALFTSPIQKSVFQCKILSPFFFFFHFNINKFISNDSELHEENGDKGHKKKNTLALTLYWLNCVGEITAVQRHSHINKKKKSRGHTGARTRVCFRMHALTCGLINRKVKPRPRANVLTRNTRLPQGPDKHKSFCWNAGSRDIFCPTSVDHLVRT